MPDVDRLYTRVDSPLGELLLVGSGGALVGVYMTPHRHGPEPAACWKRDDGALRESARQLAEYFAGIRTEFDLRLAPEGTPFQVRVWQALLEIPYGETEGYGDLAARIGSPGGARAVGMANGRNPISIIVPCHRVIGASGDLTGYGGGLQRKRWLLDHEAAVLAAAQHGV